MVQTYGFCIIERNLMFIGPLVCAPGIMDFVLGSYQRRERQNYYSSCYFRNENNENDDEKLKEKINNITEIIYSKSRRYRGGGVFGVIGGNMEGGYLEY